MRKLILSLLVFVSIIEAKEIYSTFDVVAKKSAGLGFTASGTIKNVYVEVGKKVKKGDILMSLVNDDSKALLNMSETSLKYAKKDYDRQVTVKNVIDKAMFDKYASIYESAKAQSNQQKAMFEKTILKAPFNGVIVDKMKEIGDVVTAQSGKSVLKIESLDDIKLVLKFDSQYWASVKVGDEFKYKLDGNNDEYKGEISKIYPTVDNQTRMITAEVEVDNIKVGLFGTGYILTKDNEK